MTLGEVLLWGAGAVVVASWMRNRLETEQSEVERLQDLRVAGEISEREFERRLEVALDDETERIRAAVEPIPGVGPSLSSYLAERFDSIDELREADVEDLREVPDVGEKRATEIQRRLSE